MFFKGLEWLYVFTGGSKWFLVSSKMSFLVGFRWIFVGFRWLSRCCLGFRWFLDTCFPKSLELEQVLPPNSTWDWFVRRPFVCSTDQATHFEGFPLRLLTGISQPKESLLLRHLPRSRCRAKAFERAYGGGEDPSNKPSKKD